MLNKFKKKLEQNKEVYLRIKVHPNSAKTEVKDILEDETVKINVSAVPEKNKANIQLIKFLAKEFNVEKSSIKILSGVSERIKLIKITWTV